MVQATKQLHEKRVMNSQAYEACSKAFQQEAGETDRKTCEFLIENEAETLGR